MQSQPHPAKIGRAFTLVELIVVMALLTIIISLAAPSLSHFFHGRDLVSEAARLLALTRYGQNQAVEVGVPMVLWIDQQAGTYGLRWEYQRNGLVSQPMTRASVANQMPDQTQPVFKLAEDLNFNIPAVTRMTNGLATIRFLPDGYIDEISLQYLYIKDRDNNSLPICLSNNRMKYELADLNNRWWLLAR